MSQFFFNGDAVLHAMLLAAGLVCLVIVAAGLACFLIGLVEGNCRNDVWYDENGRHRDRPHH